MALASTEIYELFLSLSATRLQTAREALARAGANERRAGLVAALGPLAVDAGLLGAEGVAALASAIARAEPLDLPRARAGLGELDRAISALGTSDASGARTDEALLLESARALLEHGSTGFTLLTDDAPSETLEAAAVDPASGDDSRWVPGLAEDMVGAFLDECVERTEGLAERLI